MDVSRSRFVRGTQAVGALGLTGLTAVVLSSPVAAHDTAARQQAAFRHGPEPESVGTSAWNDFNKDGYADLAIGVPDATVGGATGAGTVVVLYGSANGLTSTGAQLWSQDTTGLLDKAEHNDHFGTAIAAGDYDGDGYGDIAIGVPGEDLRPLGSGTPIVKDQGMVQVIFGSAAGLTDRDTLVKVPLPGLHGAPRAGYLFGSSLAALDAFNGTSYGHDGVADLGIGMPGASSGAGGWELVSSGAVAGGGGATLLELSSAGTHASLGSAMAAGDFDANGEDDLAVGAPFAEVPDAAHPGQSFMDAGMVVIVSVHGVSDSESTIYEGKDGGAGSAAAFDHFGSALAVADDPDGNGYDSLFVGAPNVAAQGEQSSGRIYRYDARSNGNGLDLPGGTSYREGTTTFPDPVEKGDHFGSAIAVADFGHGTGIDIVVGANGQSRNGKASAGAVLISYSDGTTDVIGQDSAGYAGSPADVDEYASTLFAANFGNGGSADLAVGITGKDVSSKTDAGQVAILYGNASHGFSSSDDQVWDESSSGVPGSAQADAHLGAAVD